MKWGSWPYKHLMYPCLHLKSNNSNLDSKPHLWCSLEFREDWAETHHLLQTGPREGENHDSA